MNTLGTRIKQLRTEKSLRQEDLAKIIMVNRATLASWEVDRALPDINVIQRIADVFNVTVDCLLGRKPPEKPKDNISSRIAELPESKKEMIKTMLTVFEMEKQKGSDDGTKNNVDFLR
jgi:transcriptional regulator with XRE-family HTH domain